MTLPTSTPPAYTQAFAHLQAGELAQAEALALQLQQDYSDWPAVYNLLAALALQQQRPERMEAALRMAVQLEPGNPEPLHNLGKLLLSQQRPGEALLLWEQGLEQAAPDAELWFDLGKLYLQAGQTDTARALQQRLWQALPESERPELGLALARVSEQLKQPELATHWYHEVLSLSPDQPAAHNGLGWLHFEAGRFDAALTAWQQVVALSPGVESYNNLAAAHNQLGQHAAAREAWQQALDHDPQHWQTRFNLAQALLQQEAPQAALDAMQPLFASDPALCVQLLASCAEAWLAQRKPELATVLLEACVKLPEQPAFPLHRLHRHRAQCAHFAMQPHLPALSQARDTAPHRDYYGMDHLAFSLPYIYASADEVQSSRQQLTQRVNQFCERLLKLRQHSSQAPEVSLTPLFLLAYQGQNDRPLLSKIGQLWQTLRPELGSRFYERYPGPRRPGPLRVGYVSAYFYPHSVLSAYGQHIIELAAEPEVEVTCFQLGQSSYYPEIFRDRVGFEILPTPDAEAILAHELDVLLYTDIGMEPQSYLLAMQRLARVQCVMNGHPVTTGLPQIDYYLSSLSAEPPDAEDHYSETLVRLPGRGGFRRIVPDSLATPEDLGLSAQATHYLCPMTLFKIHPDFDPIVAGILRSDPRARVHFVAYHNTVWHQALQQRFARVMPDVAERIDFLPWMDARRFQQTLLASDAVLDSLHFGGGTTCRQMVNLGKPYVTLPGEFVRGRFGYANLSVIGVTDTVASSPEDYIAKAVRLATDHDWRHDVEARLHSAVEASRDQPFRHIAPQLDFFRRAVAAAPEKITG